MIIMIMMSLCIKSAGPEAGYRYSQVSYRDKRGLDCKLHTFLSTFLAIHGFRHKSGRLRFNEVTLGQRSCHAAQEKHCELVFGLRCRMLLVSGAIQTSIHRKPQIYHSHLNTRLHSKAVRWGENELDVADVCMSSRSPNSLCFPVCNHDVKLTVWQTSHNHRKDSHS